MNKHRKDNFYAFLSDYKMYKHKYLKTMSSKNFDTNQNTFY